MAFDMISYEALRYVAEEQVVRLATWLAVKIPEREEGETPAGWRHRLAMRILRKVKKGK